MQHRNVTVTETLLEEIVSQNPLWMGKVNKVRESSMHVVDDALTKALNHRQSQ